MSDEFEDFNDEEEFNDEEDNNYSEKDLNILKTFYDDENIIYLILEDGTYKIIQCSGINEAKNLHLALINR